MGITVKSKNVPQFITEDDLRQHFGLREGGEIQLAPGTRFTPAAQQMMNDKKITVRWRDEKGQVFIETAPSNDAPCGVEADALTRFEKVHPLTSTNVRPQNTCSLCQGEVAVKPALLTHLDNQLLVLKSHPRIVLRGKLDSCICYCVSVQCDMTKQSELVRSFMSDIRSYLGQVLQAEVTGHALPAPSLGAISSATLHQWSHNPLKFLGHDHMLPDVIYGPLVAKLNVLRSHIRELELAAIEAFSNHTPYQTNPETQGTDIVAGLNRLSSAVYVVMILVWQTQNGQTAVLDAVLKEARE